MALRDINLVPPEILARRHLFRHLWLWAGCLTISLAMIFGWHLYRTTAALAKKGAFSDLKEMQISLASKIEEIKRIQKELGNLYHKQSMLENLTTGAPYSLVLLKLGDMMNGHTWLTRLDIQTGENTEGDVDLKLTGFSFHNEELGDFINRLSSDPVSKAVLLKYAKESKMELPGHSLDEPVRLIQFQIECKTQWDNLS